jgi:hypothetical protein
MTQHRDIQGLLDVWLREGSAVAPDRVLDAVADRIERQRQRGAWRFPTWEIRMPALSRVAAVSAVLAVAAAGAIYVGSSRPSPTIPVPSPSPTARPSGLATGPSPSPYVLASGLPYQSPGTVSWTAMQPGVRVEVPFGWATGGSTNSFGMTYGLIHDDVLGDSGNIAGSILVRSRPVLGNVDSCPDTRTAPPTPGPAMAAAEIAAALLVDPRFAVAAAAPITIDGTAVQVFDVKLAPGFAGTCMGDGPSALLLDEPGSFVVLQDDEAIRLLLLDVGDVPLAILIWPEEETDDAFLARSMPLVTGITFLP